MINLCTDEGLQDIAKYNGYEEEWDGIKKRIRWQHIHDSKTIKLYAKHCNKHKYHLDPIEGGHRRAGTFQANFCAQLNPEDGSI